MAFQSFKFSGILFEQIAIFCYNDHDNVPMPKISGEAKHAESQINDFGIETVGNYIGHVGFPILDQASLLLNLFISYRLIYRKQQNILTAIAELNIHDGQSKNRSSDTEC